MLPEDLQEARDWLERADDDLQAAELLFHSPGLLGAVAFHTQQAAEKALKGFLAARAVIFPRTHDLERILRLCANVDPSFTRFQTTAETLSPYVALFRYPGGPAEPSLGQAEQALQYAREIVDFARRKLPPGGAP